MVRCPRSVLAFPGLLGWMLLVDLAFGQEVPDPNSASVPVVREAQPLERSPRPPTLRWSQGHGAQRCAQEGDIVADVTRRLGYPLEQSTANLQIEGTVEQSKDGWVAHLYTRDPSGAPLGERSISSTEASCRSLDAAVGLAIALTIDPNASLDGPPPTIGHVQSREQSPMPRQVGARTVGPARSRSSNTAKPGVELAAGMSHGLVPGSLRPTVELEAMGPIMVPLTWHLGALHVPQAKSTWSRAGFEADIGFGITAFYLGGCGAGHVGPRLALEVCLSGEVGGITTVVYDPLAPIRPGERPWGAVRGRAGARVKLVGPLQAEASMVVHVPLVRWRFNVLGEQAPVFEQPFAALGGRFGLGLELP